MNPSSGSPSFLATVPLARHYRKHPTRSEAIFWRAVCQKQLGVRVRRQHPLHPCIADFFIASHRLAIEIDGPVHDSDAARLRDTRRDAELARCYGVRMLRIRAELVECDLHAALAIVRYSMTSAP